MRAGQYTVYCNRNLKKKLVWSKFSCHIKSSGYKSWHINCKKQQECIPVGCIPSAAVAISPGGVCLSACWDTNPSKQTPQEQTPPPEQTPQSRHPPGADPSEQTPSIPQSRPPRADTLRGADTPPEQMPPKSRHSPREQTPPQSRHSPVDKMTDTCKNITFATSLQTVINRFCHTYLLHNVVPQIQLSTSSCTNWRSHSMFHHWNRSHWDSHQYLKGNMTFRRDISFN